MKAVTTVAVALSLIAVSAPAKILYETDQVTRIQRPERAPQTIGEAIQRVRNQRRASVIQIDYDDSAFLIPIAGNAAGSLGTYFRSDLAIANHREVAQRVGVGFLKAGQNNSEVSLQFFSIPANTTQMTDDFVGTVLHETGLGSIVVFGVDAEGENDSEALLDGISRIWTPQPGSTGTVSQTFDAVALLDLIGDSTAYINGLKQSTAFRSNIGIVNLDVVPHTWVVRSMQTGASTTITVPPVSVIQTNAPAGSANANGQASFTLDGAEGELDLWSAYGSSTDNVTGDGWVSRAKQ
jgi:hypothetical protein